MKAKELAEELMKNPEMVVVINDGVGPRKASLPYKMTVTEDCSMDIVGVEDLVGEEVLALNAWGE